MIPGTVVAARSADELGTFDTGMTDGKLADEIPFPVDRAVLERGRERYMIFCSPATAGWATAAG